MCGVVWGWGYVSVSDKHAWHSIIPSLSLSLSCADTPHLFTFLNFSSTSFLFPLNILSLSKFLLLFQSPLSSSHFLPPSFSSWFLQPLKPSNYVPRIGSSSLYRVSSASPLNERVLFARLITGVAIGSRRGDQKLFLKIFKLRLESPL